MCLRMNSPATSRVDNGGCPGPTLQTEPHQRMAWIDELLQGRLKQIVLTIVARLAHGLPPTANLAVEGIMGRQNRESQNARKPPPAPSFLAKSNTCSGQISPIDQAFQNSSRATNEVPRSAQ